jgi:hypothetical protein
MIDYKSYVETVILRGTFVLSEMEDKINKLWVEGKLTDADREALLPMAAEYADDVFQTNVLERLTKVEHDIWEILHPVDQYRVWSKGMDVLRHEIVRYDVTGDGELDLCQYNGGRASTISWIGGIEGWQLLDRELNIIANIVRDADKNFIIVPIEPEPEPEPEPTPEPEPSPEPEPDPEPTPEEDA